MQLFCWVIINIMELSTKQTLYLTSAAVGLAGGIVYYYFKNKQKLRNALEIFDYLNIEIVQTEDSCDKVVYELRRRAQQYGALGFDCEWVTEKKGKRRPVAFIQLSSYDGYCGLFKLSAFQSIPLSLNSLLEDNTLYKVGITPDDDSNKLCQDYGVQTTSTLDLRFLAQCCGYETGGLAALSKDVLGAVMDKSWKIRCSNWEAEQLSDQQIHYAAIDAHVAIKIYAVLIDKLRRKNKNWLYWNRNWNPEEFVRKFTNKKFKLKHNVNNKVKTKEKKKEPNGTIPLSKRYPNAMRSKPLYHNCFLQAPDGELLCTCDNDKATWYVDKQLADVVVESPLTVRLRFEPAGRSVGDVGRYYQLEKENRCVVCGSTNSYIRKNVVPREYRKYLPEVMKEHSSHDVVLLCRYCHQISNMRDQAVREKLAFICCVPITKKLNEDHTAKKIRSAARALKVNGQNIPEARRKELEDIVLKHYPHHDEITVELLDEASHVQVVYENADYACHGLKVVEYFLERGGLLKLEELWRQHFLDSMQPKYMPELWSIKHNEERLRVKWNEGRLSEEQLKAIGLTKL